MHFYMGCATPYFSSFLFFCLCFLFAIPPMSFFVFQPLLLFLLLLSSSPLLTKQSPKNPRILGGEIVPSPDQYPWLVRLLFRCPESELFDLCGGSLINNNTILTAAHCYNFTCPNRVITWVQRGNVYLDTTWGSFFEERAPSRVQIYDQFNNDPISPSGDIALWQVSKPFTKVEKFATLATSDLYPGSIVGWGRINERLEETDGLRVVNLSIRMPSVCQRISEEYNTRDFDEEKEICAGGEGKEDCVGDSGGPLFDDDGVVYGVSSYGPVECDSLSLEFYFILLFSFLFFSFLFFSFLFFSFLFFSFLFFSFLFFSFLFFFLPFLTFIPPLYKNTKTGSFTRISFYQTWLNKYLTLWNGKEEEEEEYAGDVISNDDIHED